MSAGRPATYETPEELQQAVDSYFEYLKGEYIDVKETQVIDGKEVDTIRREWTRFPENATITGLVLHLGFVHRQSLTDYEKRNDEFSDIIKKARTRVESDYEKQLYKSTPTGAIFALKNMGWKDKQETEHSGTMGITWNEQKTYETEPKADASH